MLTIYKASAGSGKTFTLTYEYIKTLLGIKLKNGGYALNHSATAPDGLRIANRHRAILAITFTNAATEEMKQRIIRQVALLAGDDIKSSPYTSKLTQLYSCNESQLRKTANKALAELLLDYSSFNVCTIDSFFQNVLRTFSRDVDRQGDYELILDKDSMISQSISLMLDELNYNPGKNSKRLIDWITAHTLEKVRDGKSYNFFDRNGKLLNQLAKEMSTSMNEVYYQYADRIREYLADPEKIQQFEAKLNSEIKRIHDMMRSYAKSIMDTIAEWGLEKKDFGSIYDRIKETAESPFKLTSKSFEIKLFTNPEYKETDLIGSKQKYENCSKQKGFGDFIERLRNFRDNAPKDYARLNLLITIKDSIGTFDFIGMATITLDKLLRETNSMLLADTTDLLCKIISENEMPFIYERLGLQLETLLIDEFQDTSPMQWKNLKPLVSNSISQGFDNLIIGDVKQSIYRFRNSDSELLGSIVPKVDFPNHISRGSDPEDNTNHRSAGDIVRFNNSVFRKLANTLNAEHYGNVVQTPSERLKNQPAFVHINFKAQPDNNKDTIIEQLAQDIIRQHDNGYRWKDILILCRRRKEIKEIISYLLKNHKEISIMSNESLLLDNSKAVQTVMSLLKLVARSYESKKISPNEKQQYADHSDVVLMMTRFAHIAGSDDNYDPESALEEALSNNGDTGDRLLREIEDIRAKNPANIVALIDAIIEYKLTPEIRESEYSYLVALQDYAIAHAASQDPSLAAFIDDYDRNAHNWTITSANDLDAVNLMTIHRSKGLEAECVHIPFGNFALTENKQTMWVDMSPLKDLGFDDNIIPPVLFFKDISSKNALKDESISPFASVFSCDERKDQMDTLNCIYVAYTRARRELIIYNNKKEAANNRKDNDFVLDLIQSIVQSHTGNCDHTINLSEFYNEEQETFTFGEPTTADVKNEKTTQDITTGEYIVSYRDDTRELVSIDDILSVDLDDNDDETKESYDKAPVFEGTTEMKEAARQGKNLHAILASMRTLDDLDNALNWQCARERVSKDEADSYRKELIDAIDNGGDMVKQWFDPGKSVLAERTIFIPDGNGNGHSLRPDRVTIDNDGSTTVIDYKFTRNTSPKHAQQVQEYMNILNSMGYKNLHGYLWYPLRKEIVTITADHNN